MACSIALELQSSVRFAIVSYLVRLVPYWIDLGLLLSSFRCVVFVLSLSAIRIVSILYAYCVSVAFVWLVSSFGLVTVFG